MLKCFLEITFTGFLAAVMCSCICTSVKGLLVVTVWLPGVFPGLRCQAAVTGGIVLWVGFFSWSYCVASVYGVLLCAYTAQLARGQYSFKAWIE